MELIARRYDTREAIRLELEAGKVAHVAPAELSTECSGDLPWIAPGLVDIQVNGFGGRELTGPAVTVDDVRQVSLVMDAHGVSRYCPTVTTHSFEVLEHSLATIDRAVREDREVAARIASIHLEGPYLSAEDGPRGAHPREHCRPPDWGEFERLQRVAGGRIRLLTLSPEYDGSPAFIRRAVASGVVAAIGHTAANSDQIAAAVEAGAQLSTHLGNGAHGTLRRHPNYIWDQMAEDRLLASLIVDGHHLPAEVVKSIVRAKTSSRCILVSDVTSLAGMPPGRYETSLGAVEMLESGRLVVAGQRQMLAGASLPITVCVANVMQFAGVDLAEAITMASRRPARLIGAACGGLDPGDLADLVLFDLPSDDAPPPRAIAVRALIRGGRVAHGEVSQ